LGCLDIYVILIDFVLLKGMWIDERKFCWGVAFGIRACGGQHLFCNCVAFA